MSWLSTDSYFGPLMTKGDRQSLEKVRNILNSRKESDLMTINHWKGMPIDSGYSKTEILERIADEQKQLKKTEEALKFVDELLKVCL